MLKHLWSFEANSSAVAQRFGVTRGWLSSAMQSVCAHANQISRFCSEIPKFFAYRQLFPDLIQQLRITANKELSQFLELDCIKLSRAQSLYNAGYRTIGDVAKSTPDDLIKSIHLLNMVQAERIISSAKVSCFKFTLSNCCLDFISRHSGRKSARTANYWSRHARHPRKMPSNAQRHNSLQNSNPNTTQTQVFIIKQISLYLFCCVIFKIGIHFQ